jgi:hypothetical protein
MDPPPVLAKYEEEQLLSKWMIRCSRQVKVKGKAIPVTSREGPYSCETSRLPHFVWTIGSQMAVRLSALHAGRSLPPGRYLVLISVRG